LTAMLNLRIGATRLSLDVGRLPPAMLDDIQRRYAAFIDDKPSTATFHVTVSVRPGAPWLPIQAAGVLPLRTRRCGPCVTCMTPTEAGAFVLTQRRGQIVLRPNGNVENCLRVLVGWDVVQRGGLLLHASGVVRTAGAFVFFGPSGAGKSTVARLSARWPVLSDDLVLVEHTSTGYWACGVPFRGNEWTAPRSNLWAPLAALLALEQAPRHARLPLPAGAGAARLVACTPYVTTCAHGAALVMRAAAAMVAVTSVARLQFCKDEHFWEVLT